MFSKYTSRQLESHWIGFKKYLPQNILELTILRFLLGWLGTFYYPAQLYLLCILFLFSFLLLTTFGALKEHEPVGRFISIQAQCHKVKKNNIIFNLIQQTICIIPWSSYSYIVSFFHVLFYFIYYFVYYFKIIIEVWFLWAELWLH